VTGEGGQTIVGAETPGVEKPKSPSCLVLHLEGRDEALKHPAVAALARRGYHVLAAEPRATGQARPKAGAIAGAPDHTPAEHGIWVGRPLLGQWVTDARTFLQVQRQRPLASNVDVVVGIGPGALVAMLAAAGANPPDAVILIDPMVSFVTDAPYAAGTPMGVLAPGILNIGDIPHLAGLVAPRRLVIAGGVSPQGKKLTQKELDEAFRFTAGVYKAMKASEKLTITTDPKWDSIDL
jgi:alpha-beta hydrolase superfamily lysophospholipase